MGYRMTDEQKSLVVMVRDFMEKEVAPKVSEYDESGEFPLELYQKAFELGLHVLSLPEEFGGSGLDYLTTVMLHEEMAKVDAGFVVSLTSTELAFKSLYVAGTKEQQKKYMDIVVPGKFGAFALTEPGAGSDAGAVRTVAARDGDSYILNGSKCFITSAEYADVYIVFASTDRSKGIKGLSAFLVERSLPGISVGKHENKMGIRISNTCDVVFEDVRVPADNLVGNEGEGFSIAMKTLDLSRPFVAAAAVGICQRALDESVKYAKERVQFDMPIASLQAIQFMLADMQILTESARQSVVYTMECIMNNEPYSMASAICKTLAGDAAVKVSQDAVQILGGYGFSKEYPVEKLYRDAKIFQIFEGTNQVQRVVIANGLLKR